MRILKYVIGGIFIITSFGMFAQSELLSGLISIILGIIILPPISEKIRSNLNLWNNKGLRYLIYFALLSLIGISSNKANFKQNIEASNDISEKQQINETLKNKNENTSGKKNESVYNSNGVNIGVKESKAVEESIDDSEFWVNYRPDVKKRILEMIRNRDCRGLQQEFNFADQNNQAQMRRTGRNNAELLDFIDTNMYKLGCYK